MSMSTLGRSNWKLESIKVPWSKKAPGGADKPVSFVRWGWFTVGMDIHLLARSAEAPSSPPDTSSLLPIALNMSSRHGSRRPLESTTSPTGRPTGSTLLRSSSTPTMTQPDTTTTMPSFVCLKTSLSPGKWAPCASLTRWSPCTKVCSRLSLDGEPLKRGEANPGPSRRLTSLWQATRCARKLIQGLPPAWSAPLI